MQTKKLLMALLLGLVTVSASTFGPASTQARYHAVFIYNCTKYIVWPVSGGQDYFTITVVNNEALHQALANMAASKQVNGMHIEVLHVTNVEKVAPSQIVILGEEAHFQLSDLQQQLAAKGTLVVTNKEGYAAKGAMINFVLRGGKVKFEMNENALTGAGLKVSANLKALAIMVK